MPMTYDQLIESDEFNALPHETKNELLNEYGYDSLPEPAEPERAWYEYVTDPLVAAGQGVIGLGSSAVGLVDLLTPGDLQGTLKETTGYDPQYSTDFLEGYLSESQKNSNRDIINAEGFGNTVLEYIKNPSAIGQELMKSAPSMLAGGAVARSLPAGISLLSRAAIGEGAVAAGGQQSELTEQLGRETTIKEKAHALATGMSTAGINRLGGVLAKKLGIADIDSWLAGQTGVAKKGTILGRIAAGGITEGVIEEMPQSAVEQLLQNSALDKPLMDGVAKAAGTGFVVGGMMGSGFNAISSPSPDNTIVTPPSPADVATAAETQASELENTTDENGFKSVKNVVAANQIRKSAVGMLGQFQTVDVKLQPISGIASDINQVPVTLGRPDQIVTPAPAENIYDVQNRSRIAAEGKRSTSNLGFTPVVKPVSGPAVKPVSRPVMNPAPAAVSGPVSQDGKKVHDYSNTQIAVTGEAAKKITTLGSKIPETELYTEKDDPSYGRETEPHVTIRYGLATDNPSDIAELSSLPPITAKMGKVSIFETDKYDVVKVEVDGDSLRAANKKVGELVDLPGETFKDYQPHATIAYVKKGEGKKYVGDNSLEGEEISIDEIELTSRDGKTHKIKLTGNSDSIGAPIETGINNPAVAETDFKTAVNSIVKDKKTASAVNSVIDARAKSLGMTTANYIKSRGIKIIPDSKSMDEKTRQANKGAVDLSKEGQAIIHAFETADASTILHELGHIFRRDLQGQELTAVENWAGVKNGVWTRAAEEKFARGWENYLATGQAPISGLQKAFDSIKKAMMSVYESITGSDIDVKVSPEVRAVFDKLLTPDSVWSNDVATAEKQGVIITDGTASILYSAKSLPASIKALQRFNDKHKVFSETKLKKYFKDLQSVSSMVLRDPARLDFAANDSNTALKKNSDDYYKRSLDFSTICMKRLALVSTIEDIQVKLGRGLLPTELDEVRNALKDKGVVVSCGACYVDSTRIKSGLAIERFILANPQWKDLKKHFLSQEGFDYLQKNHSDVYKAFNAYAAPQLIKTSESRTEYKGEILKLSKSMIDTFNSKAGLRWQSWSDFEAVHMLDAMQAVVDHSAVGLKGHTYTKVPEMVESFGHTGIMMNMSLIASGNGLNTDGTLAFDPIEGMPIEEAMRLRDKFTNTAGTILIGINDAHIRAAMADTRIDYLIPYHASGLNIDFRSSRGMESWEDYTKTQNHRINDAKKLAKAGGMKEFDDKYHQLKWFDRNKTGDQNAQAYLEMCDEYGITPLFDKFKNESGYWKVLIDRKMYNNQGSYIEQGTVTPRYDMKYIEKMLKDYTPVRPKPDQETSDLFVEGLPKELTKEELKTGTQIAIEKNNDNITDNIKEKIANGVNAEKMIADGATKKSLSAELTNGYSYIFELKKADTSFPGDYTNLMNEYESAKASANGILFQEKPSVTGIESPEFKQWFGNIDMTEFRDQDDFVEKLYKRSRRKQANFKRSIAKRMGGKYTAKAKVPENIAHYMGDYGSKLSFPEGDVYLGASSENHVIYVSNIAVTTPGSGLGTKFMETLRDVADETAQDISIYKVTNKEFFRKFNWLEETNGAGEFTYKNSGNFIGVSKLADIWEKQSPGILFQTDEKIDKQSQRGVDYNKQTTEDINENTIDTDNQRPGSIKTDKTLTGRDLASKERELRKAGFYSKYDEWQGKNTERGRRSILASDVPAGRGKLPTDVAKRNFDKWFKGSLAVDTNGEPMVWFHGSPTFGVASDPKTWAFDQTRRGENVGHTFTGLGMTFTPSYEMARTAARGGQVTGFNLQIRNPYVLNESDIQKLSRYSKNDTHTAKAEAFAKRKMELGDHDSIYNPETGFMYVLESVQSKEIRNTGAYSEDNPDILFQNAESVVPADADKLNGFKTWTKGMEPIDGYELADAPSAPFVAKLYHGTTHEFTVFDPTIKGNKEGAFGAVNYFTSDAGDADLNYAGEGPDLTQRIEMRSEQLYEELSDEYDIEDQDDVERLLEDHGLEADDIEDSDDIESYAKAIARNELSGGTAKTMELYVRLDNPAFINGNTKTYIQNTDREQYREDAIREVKDQNDATDEQIEDGEFDDEIEEYIDESAMYNEPAILEALSSALYESETGDVNPAEIYQELDIYDDEISADDLYKALKESETLSYVEDYDNGGLLSSHIIGQVFKNLGFDGIVLQNADRMFPGMNMGSETSHVHVFEETPGKIKSATDNTGAYSEDNPDILFQTAEAIYSKLSSVATADFQGMKAQGVVNFLNKKGVKKSEMDATGLIAWLATKKGTDKVTRDELMNFVEANTVELDDVVLGDVPFTIDDFNVKETRKYTQGSYAKPDTFGTVRFINKEDPDVVYVSQLLSINDTAIDAFNRRIKKGNLNNPNIKPTHFQEYTEPGAEEGSYREMFVTAPSKDSPITEEEYWELRDLDKKEPYDLTDTDRERRGELQTLFDASTKTWQDGHEQYSDITNPIVRIRFNEINTDGKRILRIEEIQGPSDANQKKMPTHLKDNIYQLGTKRIIAYAKENGFDGVAFAQKEGRTAGETQADRYSLEKQISKIEYEDVYNGDYGWRYKIDAYDLDGDKISSEYYKNDELPDAVGKEIAKKILDSDADSGKLSGLDLKVGGEGLKRLYDDQLPKMLEAYSKNKFTDGVLPITKKTPESFVLFQTAEITPQDYIDNRNTISSTKNRVTRNLKSMARETAKGFDKFMGSISTRLEDINPRLKADIRRLDFNIGTKQRNDVEAVLGMLNKTKEMSREDFKDWDYARKNSDKARMDKLIEKYNFRTEYDLYRKTLDNIHSESEDVGLDVGYVKDYSPRILKDKVGFLNHIGKGNDWGRISEALRKRADEMGVRIEDMSVEMKADLVSNMMFGGMTGSGSPGHTKSRKMVAIPSDLNQYYMDSDSALVSYMHSMRKTIEQRKFFGKVPKKITQAKTNMHRLQAELRKPDITDERKKTLKDNIFMYRAIIDKFAYDRTDYNESISQYVMEQVLEGNINHDQENILTNIMQARFNEHGTSGLIQAYKNFSYIDTMGSPISALTQIGDQAFAAYEGGWITALKNSMKAFRGKSRITKEDVGIDRMAQEFADESTLSSAVNRVFKIVGLEKIDSIGKESLLNTSLEKYEKRARKNPTELTDEISHIFGDETQSVISDLQNKQITDNVKLLVYSRLLDFQPAALSEMSEQYLKAGNGRIFYMLKTYTLKQFDVFRRESYKKIRHGTRAEKIEGVKNMVRLSMFLVLANAGADELKDLVLRRDTDMSDRLVDNILRLFGVSKFTAWQARQEGLPTALLKQILPPFKFFNSLTKDIVGAGDGKGLYMTGSVPVVGKLYDWHMGRSSHKRADLQQRRLSSLKSKYNKIKDRVERHPEEANKYRKDLRTLTKINKKQAEANALKKQMNDAIAKGQDNKAKRLEDRRNLLIQQFLNTVD